MQPDLDYKTLCLRLTKRYGDIDPASLEKVLCPILVPIHTLDKTIKKEQEQNHYKAKFSLKIDDENRELMVPGRTGKFVPKTYVDGGLWKEIAKGRILSIDAEQGLAEGEVYIGGSKKAELERALQELSEADFLEIDQYGAAAKVLSALVEYSLSRICTEKGYLVKRMPEDVAKHVGTYYYYDFQFEKDEVRKRIEVKSLWGTDTRYARLIHSKSKRHATSSCKFAAQDIFAVSLFLRTGNIEDFAFARSVAKSDDKPYGLPHAKNQPDYVHQNPPCEIGNGIWFGSIDEVWNLE